MLNVGGCVLLETAYTLDTSFDSILAGGSMKVADPFDMGAGQIEPLKALDPGLIYDIKPSDYILFLCNSGFTQRQINNIVVSTPATKTSCTHLAVSNANLNYPSVTVSNLESTITITRTVRNVGGNKNVIYFSIVIKPYGVEVVLWPRILIFSRSKQENTYCPTQDRKAFTRQV